MTAAFAFIVGGGLILLAGIRNRSLTEILRGITSANPVTGGIAAPTASGSTAAPPAPGGKGGNRALGHALMQQHYPHWGNDQWACLEQLWTQESGWSETAKNPSSGAYGIPQSLPASKMGPAAQGSGHSAAVAQIIWGLNYIHGRYGTPCAAWAHEKANNWY